MTVLDFMKHLRSGAVPVAQNVEFWDKLFGYVPFPVIQSYEQWKGYILTLLMLFPT